MMYGASFSIRFSFSSLGHNFPSSSFSSYGSTILQLFSIKFTAGIILVLLLCEVPLYAHLMYTLKCSKDLLSKTDSVQILRISFTMRSSKSYFRVCGPESPRLSILSTNIFFNGLTSLSMLLRSSPRHARRSLSPVT